MAFFDLSNWRVVAGRTASNLKYGLAGAGAQPKPCRGAKYLYLPYSLCYSHMLLTADTQAWTC